ncbi:MFS transporter [Chlorogloeopsis sp. ULAP02]|uniref:MFS transporter n=1 Tax=Chlorogloeopsis sp. ULAP02 TaxID=3107926 RepID=UPI0031353851
MLKRSIFLSPWTFIPTLYFASGIPYVIINTVSVIFYKRMGVDNAQITLWTSFLYLPWVIKMFWGPVVDIYSTKRTWIITSQIAMFLCLVLVAFSLQLPNFFFISLVVLTLGAFISATYDIATDGFYLLALKPEQQAFFVGIRSLFYRLAIIFCSGILVFLAGKLEIYFKNIPLAWTLIIGFSSAILLIIFIFHRLILPFPDEDATHQYTAREKIPFLQIITSYFTQEKIVSILAFILLYRFGEAMLVKIASLFLLDKLEVGGLGLSTSDLGLVYGTSGVVSLILGGILGGIVISKYGLKKCIWPMALAMNLPNIFYVYMAYTQPSLTLISPLVSLEQFGYGFGFTAFSVYLMYISQGEYKTSHFAISTGIMALGMMLPGLISGYLQQAVGYPIFFILVCLFTIPGMISMLFIPLKEEANPTAR